MSTTTKNQWNPELNKDTVGFSAVLVSTLVVTWFAAATSMAELETPGLEARSDQTVNDADNTRIVVTAPRLKVDRNAQTRTMPVKSNRVAKTAAYSPVGI